jgi:hypothetical protein
MPSKSTQADRERLDAATLVLISSAQAVADLPSWQNDEGEQKAAYNAYFALCRLAAELKLPRPPSNDAGDHRVWARVFRRWWEESNGMMDARVADLRTAPPHDTEAATPASDDEPGLTWQEAAERMKQLQAQGIPFTSQSRLADGFDCSSGTINKAIKNTPELHPWAYEKAASAPRAQSIDDVVTDQTAQTTEPDPADEVAIREYLERENLTPEDRAVFNAKSREDQVQYLEQLAELEADQSADDHRPNTFPRA